MQKILNNLIEDNKDQRKILNNLIEDSKDQRKILENLIEDFADLRGHQTCTTYKTGDEVYYKAHHLSKAPAKFHTGFAPKWWGPVSLQKRVGKGVFHSSYHVKFTLVSDMDQRTPENTPLEQVAKLLGISQQLLRTASTVASSPATTVARVRWMPLEQLKRDPVLWAAYTRGWEGHMAAGRRATDEPPAKTNQYRSPRRPAQPAGMTRPPPLPLMAKPIPWPTETVQPAPRRRTRTPSTPPAPTTRSTAAATAAAAVLFNARKCHNQTRNQLSRAAKRAADVKKSRKFRLENPTPPTTPPPPPTTPPAPDTQTQEVATPSDTEAAAP
ncbi:mucin-2-like [Aphis craccivora]|uniref:Mucin-2-like n=1 Tax=Aphis craccivora TaxID=307492 RepID=A0A6G0YY70_APHCR|nr:mucin-2-like [Aphis craccivora]